MSNPNSLYNVIKANLKDGRLPREFSLPKPKDSDQNIPFADGAMDGIYIYHMEHSGLTGEQHAVMELAVDYMNQADIIGADTAFKKLGSMAGAISSLDELQRYIVAHAVNPNDKPDPARPNEIRLTLKNICDTARRLIAESENKESVKYALAVCEIFRHHPDDIKEIITTLGLSDEFTIFSVWNMMNWEDGNARIFDLIQKVRGWGRIHALDKLEPDTPEIRHWILMEGTDNDVMPAYSGLTAWIKSGALDLLKAGPTAEEFHAISYLMDAILDEGPVPGLSQLEDPEDALDSYLDQAEKQELEANDLDTILMIRDRASEEDMLSIKARCDAILNSPGAKDKALEAVKEGKNIQLAEALNIDYSGILYDLMKQDFDKYHGWCGKLMAHEEYVDPVIDLFMEKLPLELMKDEPTLNSGLGPEFNEYSKLLFILQELDKYPGKGEELILTGLRSPVVNNRFKAVTALKNWTHRLSKPLRAISPKIAAELYKLPAKEPNSEIKEDMLDLLKGKIYSSTDLNPEAN